MLHESARLPTTSISYESNSQFVARIIMSLSYGLNITKKAPSLGSRLQTAKRKTIFDDDSGAEDDANDEESPESVDTVGGLTSSHNPQTGKIINRTTIHGPTRPNKQHQVFHYSDLSAHLSSSKHAKSAQAVDPSIYDYDSVYDSLHSKPPGSSESGEQEKRPKYMGNLLAAAEVRKRDQLRAKEKMLAKEREAEGDEFADKEKFVTAAYKRQQTEMRRLEEEEAIREKEAEERKRREGGGLKGLYKNMLERGEQKHAAVVKAVEEAKTRAPESKNQRETPEKIEMSEMDIAKEKGAIINEDGQVVDKRQLLSAGLNAGTAPPKRRTVGHIGTRKESSRERETRLFEEQLLGKRDSRSEDDEETVEAHRAAKSRKLEDEILGLTK